MEKERKTEEKGTDSPNGSTYTVDKENVDGTNGSQGVGRWRWAVGVVGGGAGGGCRRCSY